MNTKPLVSEYWVHAIARESKNRSKVGPFGCPLKAVQFMMDERPAIYWQNVSISRKKALLEKSSLRFQL